MLMEMISLTSYTGPLHCHACWAEHSTAARNLTQFKIKNLTGLQYVLYFKIHLPLSRRMERDVWRARNNFRPVVRDKYIFPPGK